MRAIKFALTVGDDIPAFVAMREYVDMAEAFWCTTEQSSPTDALPVRVMYIENKMCNRKYAKKLQNKLIPYMISRAKILLRSNDHISLKHIRRQAMIYRMKNILYIHAHQSCWNAIATFPKCHKKAIYQLYWFLQQMTTPHEGLQQNIPHDAILHILAMVHIKDIHTPFLYHSLSQDIIKKVLSFIDFREQITTCSLVSKNFNTLVTMINFELPQDIIKKVLTFIDFREHITTCSLVSNNFKTLVNMLNSEYVASIDIASGDDDVSMDSSFDADGESTDSSYTEG